MLPTSYRRENAKTENEAEEDMLLVPTYLTKKKIFIFLFYYFCLQTTPNQVYMHIHTYMFLGNKLFFSICS